MTFLALMSVAGCDSNKEIIVYKDSISTPAEIKTLDNNEFGPLTVKQGEFTGSTKIIPWSSWWFPTKDKYLFENKNEDFLAPLQKYDLFVKENYKDDPESALFERLEIYNPIEVNWAGLCDAWAIASVLRVEPKEAIIRKNIAFSVADQKSLLLKSYDNATGLKIYGNRNNGSYKDDFNDIYADQFHRFAQVFLFEKNLPFLMDYDPSVPVWTVPVYNIKFKIVKLDEVSAHVRAWVTIATPFVDDPNFVGTKKSVKFYEYNLTGQWINDELKVTGAEWINDSIYDHPDYLIAYPTDVKFGSRNSKLEKDKIDSIVGTNYVGLK